MSSNHQHDPAAVDAPGGTQTLERCDLPIEGMTCAACAAAVERRLARQPGVSSASVNFATKVATVQYKPGATSPAALALAVDEIGYHAIVPAPADAASSDAAAVYPGDAPGSGSEEHA